MVIIVSSVKPCPLRDTQTSASVIYIDDFAALDVDRLLARKRTTLELELLSNREVAAEVVSRRGVDAVARAVTNCETWLLFSTMKDVSQDGRFMTCGAYSCAFDPRCCPCSCS